MYISMYVRMYVKLLGKLTSIHYHTKMFIKFYYLGTFIQPATAHGPSSVCVGTSVTFNCTVRAFIDVTGYIIVGATWKRNGVVITDNTPHHTLLQTPNMLNQLVVTGLMVDNTTLDDDGTVYTCTAAGAFDNFTSSVVLNISGGMYYMHIH